METKEQFISAETAASIMDVRVETLTKWRHFGKGPRYYKIGRAAKYLETDVRAWMLKQARQPGEAA